MIESDEFDPVSPLRSATRRAKSDVANKLISMFLHRLSRSLCAEWNVRIEADAYLSHVREFFGGRCPYCRTMLTKLNVIVEHPDGMNRLRVGLHVPGNVVLACRQCNSEKRRDDSLLILTLADSGWESFLSHDGMHCEVACRTCGYWKRVWPDETERKAQLNESLQRMRRFREMCPNFARVVPYVKQHLPRYLAILYKECQEFADARIDSLMKDFLDKSPIMSDSS